MNEARLIQLSLAIFLFYVLSCTDSSETRAQYAEVMCVEVSGDEQNYSFSVTLKSPDTGCEQFADWWEVITPEGDLIYRRILLHSHVKEQPFTRSGGPVEIEKNQELIIRAHMNTSGYGSVAMRGSVADGFKKVILTRDFASSLEKKAPLPTGCAF
jgi:hypothetical protein